MHVRLVSGSRGFDPPVRQHSFVEMGHEIISTAIIFLPLIQVGQLSVTGSRVRATSRHYRQMRRKNIFGTKNHYLAKTSGEKKSPLKKSAPKNATYSPINKLNYLSKISG